jgi:hypothetical protein
VEKGFETRLAMTGGFFCGAKIAGRAIFVDSTADL